MKAISHYTNHWQRAWATLAFIVMLAIPTSLLAAQPTPVPTVSPATGALASLYRATVTLANPADIIRLGRLDVALLEFDESTATVLIEGQQLEDLARLGFEPNQIDEVVPLLSQQAISVAANAALTTFIEDAALMVVPGQTPTPAALAALRDLAHSLEPEQRTFLAQADQLDTDGDGLTDTEEGYWCTGVNRKDSDSDGTSDGAEVVALKEWLNATRSSTPSSGKPFAGWPNDIDLCNDDDRDSIPDLAEQFVLGLDRNKESSDGDKFDDGQEVFGLTLYPNYGGYPRLEDTFITTSMPGWVDSPGNHPLVAAYPEITIEVVPDTFSVVLRTTITAEQSQAEGKEFGYETTSTTGQARLSAKKRPIPIRSGWKLVIVLLIAKNARVPE
ncbi:hypothetical protein HC928_07175 [bacterium]|nr:hypothetical protein [bacterium]